MVRDSASALAVASAALAEYAQQRNGATLIVVQSSVPAQQLRRSVPVLADFPCAEMAPHAADSSYPQLGWQTFAARRCFERLARCEPWLERQQHMARFANLPVGNLGSDALVRCADAAFARLLRRNRHLLWASESNKPDLGVDDLDGSSSLDCDDLDQRAADHADAPGTSFQRKRVTSRSLGHWNFEVKWSDSKDFFREKDFRETRKVKRTLGLER